MIREHTQHIALLSVRLRIPQAQSLKSKRMVTRSIKDRIRSRFNVSVAELDGQDKWQWATFDFAMIGNDRAYLDRCMQNILSLMEANRNVEVIEHELEFI